METTPAGANHARVDDPRTWPEHIRQRYGIGHGRRATIITVVVLAAAIAPFATHTTLRQVADQGVLTAASVRIDDAETVTLSLTATTRPFTPGLLVLSGINPTASPLPPWGDTLHL